MKKNIGIHFVSAFILSAGLFAPMNAKAEIVFGVVGPLTGQYAVNGEQMRRGVEQAAKDINAAGGINGEKIKLEIVDDACDPKQAVAAANQMASKGIKYVVGHYCSGSAIPASKIYLDEGILLISPGATNPKLTEEGAQNIFRVCGRDDKQGAIIADVLKNEFKGKKVALLHDKSAYGRGLVDEVKKNLNSGGIQETIFESFSAGEKDYSALVGILKQKSIDVLFVGGYHTETALIARQLRAAGSSAQIIGGDALVTSEFSSIAGAAAEGVLMTFGPDPRKKPQAEKVVKALRDAGYEPEGYTLYSYAAAQIFEQAIKAAGSNDSAKVLKNMRTAPFKTVLGDIGFDAKGDVTAPAYVLYVWKNGLYAERL